MSSIRRRRLGAATFTTAGILSLGLPAPATAAEEPSVLRVENRAAANCSDSGSGSIAQPYCTIQAAVNAAKPGQTVLVVNGRYGEKVTVTRSGEPGLPITIKSGTGVKPRVGVTTPDLVDHAFVLTNVHDVTVQGFRTVPTLAESVLVSGSQRIVVDQLELQSPEGSAAPAIRVTGASGAVTVSRNRIGGWNGGGVAVDAGVTGAVVTTNAITFGRTAGILVTDAPGTVITGNTVVAQFAPGISLAGASSGSVVRNNIIADGDSYNAAVNAEAEQTVELSVSAGSVPGTTADHNSLWSHGESPAYSWGGQKYRAPAEFAAASGQGKADLLERPAFQLEPGPYMSVVPTAASGSTDAADLTGITVPDTDSEGRLRVDHPGVANSAGGFVDRGAAEFQAYSRLAATLDVSQGPYPLKVKATATAFPNWPDSTTAYRYDFGDGSEPVVSTEPTASHTYTAKGDHLVRVSVAGADPNTALKAGAVAVKVNEPGELVNVLTVTPVAPSQNQGPLAHWFDLSASTSPWRILRYQVDFGDGSAKADQTWGSTTHDYAQPGVYTVTATLTDEGGRTSTVTRQLKVAYAAAGFTAITPTRLLDTRLPGMWGLRRLGPGESIDVSLLKPSAEATVLNVTAVDPGQGGFLSVYPGGAPVPGTSSLNFLAGQTVSNLVTVPGGVYGRVTVRNGSGGPVDVLVDQVGYYQEGSGDRFGALAPSRVLDTRAVGGAVVPDGTVSFQVRGAGGVPADAKSVVLNLTVTEPSSGGFLTAYASGTEQPGTSSLNFSAGQTLANQVVVPIGEDGKVTVANRAGRSHVVADVFGYYGPSGDSLFTPVVPRRLVDTREGTGPVGANAFLKVASGAPAGATGAVLNVTAVTPSSGGYLTVWADGAARPGTSNLNFLPGQVVPNHVTTPLSAAGAFDVYNPAGRTDVVADLFGYFTK
ncbi:PKD domain-containing protein [Kitasatospora gansuensis]